MEAPGVGGTVTGSPGVCARLADTVKHETIQVAIHLKIQRDSGMTASGMDAPRSMGLGRDGLILYEAVLLSISNRPQRDVQDVRPLTRR